ncbi:hypothetical protein L208DRAFT_1235806 [Tricholoma matsutake]|nr:hypothetical protein L208DRAFT_1235806 [Tricholoma matsutake 945]
MIIHQSLSRPIPTRREILAAVSLVKKYIDLVSDPLARKLDALLDYNLRIEHSKSMQPTHITSYFSRTSS